MWTKYIFLFFLILVPFNFIDADERNANVDRRTRIIHKLTASCLELSFHLLLLLYLKCKTTIQSGHSYADFPPWSLKILPLNLDVFL